jgi:hypothetical protein
MDLDSLCDLYCVIADVITNQVNPRGDIFVPLLQVLKRTCEDIQERLVYVTRTFVNSDIRDFIPAQGQLDYPTCLQGRLFVFENLTF